MGCHDEKIEFRCPESLKRRLLECRIALGTRTVSDTSRALLETGLRNIDGLLGIGAIGSLREAAVHLDRIAGVLQRSAMRDATATETLAQMSPLLVQIKAILEGASHLSAPPCRDEGRPVRRRST